jgi:hypothetical protein
MWKNRLALILNIVSSAVGANLTVPADAPAKIDKIFER